MANKTPELIRRGIQRELKKGKGKQAIAEQFSVSLGTVKRIAKETDLTAADPVDQLERAIASVTAGRFDLISTLEVLINNLETRMADAQVKSYEGAASAICKVAELHRRYKPLTLDEGIDLLLDIPGVSPQAIARRLRERLEETG